jgi:predicted DNA-binding transcriptional regulator AlpA
MVDSTDAVEAYPEYLNTPQAAAYLGLSESLLEKRRCTGGGPPYSKIGKAVRYLRDDLDVWMHATRRQSVMDPEVVTA